MKSKLINKIIKTFSSKNVDKKIIKNKPRVIVIGNSPKILETEYGDIIDNFDVVIRLNSFNIKGYEKHTGKKTDKILITFAVPENKNFSLVKKSEIYLFGAKFTQDRKFLQNRLNHPKVGCKLNLDEINLLDEDIYFHQLSDKVCLEKGKWCSTGVIAIDWAFNNYSDSEIYIHGFSFFEESGDLLQHYYGVATKRDKSHEFDKEKFYIESLIKNDKVKTLVDTNNYIVVSHWPREKSTSPCGSVYEVFLSKEAPLRQFSSHIHTNQTSEEIINDFSIKDRHSTLIFNGMVSLLLHESTVNLVKKAIAQNNKIIIYWHETAWLISLFQERYKTQWGILFPLLIDYAEHWVPTMQSKQLIMYIFKRKFEDVKVVGEAIKISTKTVDKEKHTYIKVCGGGITDYRKGFDYFIKLSDELTSLNGTKCKFYWHARSDKKQLQKAFKSNMDNIDILSYVDNFVEYLASHYDIYIMSSRDDPSPIVAYSALAADIPVFCFDSVGTAELVSQEFIASDYNDMINKIKVYWENKEKYKKGHFQNRALCNTPEEFVKKINFNQIGLITGYKLPYK